MSARVSHDRAFEDIRALLDPEDTWWFTMGGLLLLTGLAQLAAGEPVSAYPQPLLSDGDELRYWLAVYRGLKAVPHDFP